MSKELKPCPLCELSTIEQFELEERCNQYSLVLFEELKRLVVEIKADYEEIGYDLDPSQEWPWTQSEQLINRIEGRKELSIVERAQGRALEMLELLKTFVDIYLDDHDIGMYSETSDLKRAVKLIQEIEGE